MPARPADPQPDPDGVRRLLLVRHGQSTWNAEGRWQGRLDPPLSDLGRHQARAAAAALGTFDLVAASTLQRAHDTATVIADELGIGPVLADPDLVERHAGGFEGLTRAEIEDAYPGYLTDLRHPPGWEDDEALVERAIGALARLAATVAAGGTALVVTHGGVIRSLERAVGAEREHRLANLGGRWFELGPGVLRADEEVLLIDAELATVPGQL